MSWKDYAYPGFVYGTVLMRASTDNFYFKSIQNILAKSRLYLISIGSEEEEEKFWITGREIATFYADSKGFHVLTDSPLGNLLHNTISEVDAEVFIKTYQSNKYRDIEDIVFHNGVNKRIFLEDLKKKIFKSVEEIIEYIKPISDKVTLYQIHTKQVPYYLEEINYGKVASCS